MTAKTDSYGHAAGDLLLQQLGDSLRRHVRESDIACRYGGEEFTLILPEASLEVTRERAEHLRLEARQIRIQAKGQVLDAITLSLGVAVFTDHGATGAAILAAADSALYRAKRDRRDRVVAAT
jgi:diguanylate cyclase (GGDEF)-like protein